MNKTELYQVVEKETGLSGRQAVKVTNIVLDAITQGIKKDKKVTITNFGTFEVKKIKAGKIHTPNGTVVKVPARNRVAFKAGKATKAAVNKKPKK